MPIFKFLMTLGLMTLARRRMREYIWEYSATETTIGRWLRRKRISIIATSDMIGFYTPVLILQAFCLYHAYRNNSMQTWFWLILLLPGIGCAIYLYHHFFNKSNIETLAEGVKNVVNTNYKLEQLERAHRLSDNITTKTNLAAAYVAYGRFDEAIALYKECLSGFMADDPILQMKLLQTYFLKPDYAAAVTLGRNLEAEKEFRKSDERISFAWALYYSGNTVDAEKEFQDMDKSSANHWKRMEYAKFLMLTGQRQVAHEKLNTLLEEFELMRGGERKVNSSTIREVKDLVAKINT
jgi:hypothetical protein